VQAPGEVAVRGDTAGRAALQAADRRQLYPCSQDIPCTMAVLRVRIAGKSR